MSPQVRPSLKNRCGHFSFPSTDTLAPRSPAYFWRLLVRGATVMTRKPVDSCLMTLENDPLDFVQTDLV
jgi:hypothetical protein